MRLLHLFFASHDENAYNLHQTAVNFRFHYSKRAVSDVLMKTTIV